MGRLRVTTALARALIVWGPVDLSLACEGINPQAHVNEFTLPRHDPNQSGRWRWRELVPWWDSPFLPDQSQEVVQLRTRELVCKPAAHGMMAAEKWDWSPNVEGCGSPLSKNDPAFPCSN